MADVAMVSAAATLGARPDFFARRPNSSELTRPRYRA
jgi:hypothetical protein